MRAQAGRGRGAPGQGRTTDGYDDGGRGRLAVSRLALDERARRRKHAPVVVVVVISTLARAPPDPTRLPPPPPRPSRVPPPPPPAPVDWPTHDPRPALFLGPPAPAASRPPDPPRLRSATPRAAQPSPRRPFSNPTTPARNGWDLHTEGRGSAGGGGREGAEKERGGVRGEKAQGADVATRLGP